MVIELTMVVRGIGQRGINIPIPKDSVPGPSTLRPKIPNVDRKANQTYLHRQRT